ncbi:MAG: site-specific integrase [Thermoguttaceae bacterium]|jgi:site-specific recombinase XerD
MTPLRERMIEDMKIRDYSEHTIAAYVSGVYRLAMFYHKSPDQLSREEIRAFLVDLVAKKKAAWSYCKQVLAALRFFYRHVLRRGKVVEDVRGPRPAKRLPGRCSPGSVIAGSHGTGRSRRSALSCATVTRSVSPKTA